jgi:predicted SAM-dependent methyltransferase
MSFSLLNGSMASFKTDSCRALQASALSTRRLHLSCGGNILSGWTNIDIEPQAGAFGWNLAEPLPFDDGVIQFVFSEHFIEHMCREAGQSLLRECRRVLAPGGALRLSTPDLGYLVEQYQLNRLEEWRDMGWSPSTRCGMINEGMRAWGHRYLYDRDELHLALRMAGFPTIRDAVWRESDAPTFRGLEIRPWHRELFVEGWA